MNLKIKKEDEVNLNELEPHFEFVDDADVSQLVMLGGVAANEAVSSEIECELDKTYAVEVLRIHIKKVDASNCKQNEKNYWCSVDGNYI